MTSEVIMSAETAKRSKDRKSDQRRAVEVYLPMVRFIAEMMGPRCEVVLHDLEDIEHSIIAIENGYVTGRKVGDGLVDFALDAIFDEEGRERDFVTNVQGKTTTDNKKLRFSGYYIRDDQGEIIGLLNVTVDVTPYVLMKNLIESEFLFSFDSALASEARDGSPYALSAAETVELICEQAMIELGYSDPKLMRKADKMKVIGMLNERNLFSMKGVVKLTARKLRISEPSVYRYIKEHRNNGVTAKEEGSK